VAQEYEKTAKELMKLTMEGGTQEQIRAKALALKQDITDWYLGVWRWLNLADNLVSIYAPDPKWLFGMLLPAAPGAQQSTPEPARTPRGARVLAIARAMVTEEHAKTVTSKAIAERLIRDGEPGNLKDLATGAGNHLARSKEWRRIKSGEYAPVQQEVSAS
jgi:hypothetical protein